MKADVCIDFDLQTGRDRSAYHRACITQRNRIETVAFIPEADRIRFTRFLADEAICIGPSAVHGSYLDMGALSPATVAMADAIYIRDSAFSQRT